MVGGNPGERSLRRAVIEFTYRSWLGAVQPPVAELRTALADRARGLTSSRAAPTPWIELDPLAPAWIIEAARDHAASSGARVRPALRVGTHLVGRGGLVLCSAPDVAGRWPVSATVDALLCVEHLVASTGTVESIRIGSEMPQAGRAVADRAPGAARLEKRVRQVGGIGVRPALDPAWCLIDVRRPPAPVLAAMRAIGVVAGEPLDAPAWGGVVAAIVPHDTPNSSLDTYAAALGEAISATDPGRAVGARLSGDPASR